MREPVGTTLKVQRGPWKTEASYAGDAVHIRPRDDLRWHPLDETCWCGPARAEAETLDGEDVPVWQHIAADGRE